MITNSNIVGLMIESNINEGRQELIEPSQLKYGVSITDGCIDYNLTKKLILDFYKKL